MSKKHWKLLQIIVVAFNLLIVVPLFVLSIIYCDTEIGTNCYFGLISFIFGEHTGTCFMKIADYFKTKDKETDK